MFSLLFIESYRAHNFLYSGLRHQKILIHWSLCVFLLWALMEVLKSDPNILDKIFLLFAIMLF